MTRLQHDRAVRHLNAHQGRQKFFARLRRWGMILVVILAIYFLIKTIWN